MGRAAKYGGRLASVSRLERLFLLLLLLLLLLLVLLLLELLLTMTLHVALESVSVEAASTANDRHGRFGADAALCRKRQKVILRCAADSLGPSEVKVVALGGRRTTTGLVVKVETRRRRRWEILPYVSPGSLVRLEVPIVNAVAIEARHKLWLAGTS